MATTLVMGDPASGVVTLSTPAGDMEEVILPAGMRTLLFQSDQKLFVQFAGPDGDPGVDGSSFAFGPGNHGWEVPGVGVGTLTEPLSIFVWGSADGQVVRFIAQVEGR